MDIYSIYRTFVYLDMTRCQNCIKPAVQLIRYDTIRFLLASAAIMGLQTLSAECYVSMIRFMFARTRLNCVYVTQIMHRFLMY